MVHSHTPWRAKHGPGQTQGSGTQASLLLATAAVYQRGSRIRISEPGTKDPKPQTSVGSFTQLLILFPSCYLLGEINCSVLPYSIQFQEYHDIPLLPSCLLPPLSLYSLALPINLTFHFIYKNDINFFRTILLPIRNPYHVHTSALSKYTLFHYSMWIVCYGIQTCRKIATVIKSISITLTSHTVSHGSPRVQSSDSSTNLAEMLNTVLRKH